MIDNYQVHEKPNRTKLCRLRNNLRETSEHQVSVMYIGFHFKINKFLLYTIPLLIYLAVIVIVIYFYNWRNILSNSNSNMKKSQVIVI